MDDTTRQHSSSDDRIPGIDVLRGIAVILVVLHHINLRFQINHYSVAALLPQSIGKILFWSGYYSVITFFVISGFLITAWSLRRWGTLNNISTSSFYRLRMARIVPCLLALLVVLSALHVMGYTDFVIDAQRATLGRALLAAFTFHINWLEGLHGYLPGNWDVLWSLSVEEMFYLLFPLLCLILRRDYWILLIIIAVIIVGPINRTMLDGRDPWSDYAYLSCMDGIAFGCLTAWILARVRRPSCGALWIIMATGLAAVMLIIVLRTLTLNLGLTHFGLNVTILEFGVALILYALANGVGSDVLSRGTASIQLIGRSSYEIYLTHMFVVYGSMHLFAAVFGKSPYDSAYFVAYIVVLLLSVALGLAVSRWYSEPLNRKLRGHMKLVSAR